MIVALPVCHKDEHLALQNLEWAHFLNNSIDYKCVVTHDTKFNPDKVVDAAKKCFKQVEVISYMPCPMPDKWPMPQNWAWQNTARLLSSQPDSWFWWEQDAIPIVSDWLSKIDELYKSGGKPFLGPIVDGGAYMAGVAVYPRNALDYCYNASIVRVHPFDIFAGKAFASRATNASKIIYHVKKAVEFYNRNDADKIPDGTAVFHKCKNGSLIKVLQGNTISVTKHAKLSKDAMRHLNRDNYDMALNYFRVIREQKKRTAIIQLGRTGDILNILPIAKMHYRHGKDSPAIYVDQRYKNIVTGTDYATFAIWQNGMDDVSGAESHAKSKYDIVLTPQLFGRGITIKGETDHFNKDHWLKCGFLDYCGNQPLEFNRRDIKREQSLIARIRKTDKPLLLLSLRGETSPFSGVDGFSATIQREYGSDFEIVDIGQIKLDYFYDMLGLYDLAELLITIDTAHIHLLNASHVPFVALLPDRDPWFSPLMWRKPKLVVRYADINSRIKEIKEAINSAYNNWASRKSLRFIHLAERHPSRTDEEYERKMRAMRSWEMHYNTSQMVPRHYWEYKRNASLIGDNRELPFLKDVLALAIENTGPNDVAVFTNDDVFIKNGFIDQMALKMKHVEMATCSRLDITNVNAVSSDKFPHYTGEHHYGRDAIVMHCDWLKKNLHKMPDYILGASDWDIGLLSMARHLRGIKTTLINWDCVFAECELNRGWLLHEQHEPQWFHPDNIFDAPSQKFNRSMVKCWLLKNTNDMTFIHLAPH